MRRWMTLIVLLPLAACALWESPADKALRRSPDFKSGYSDGCASAGREDGANKRESGLMRDDESWRNNKAYHSGWNEGFGACRSYRAPTTDDRGPSLEPRLGGGATPF